MKNYSKEVYVFEFNKEEVKLFDQILQEVLVSELSEEQQELLNDIQECNDSILHP